MGGDSTKAVTQQQQSPRTTMTNSITTSSGVSTLHSPHDDHYATSFSPKLMSPHKADTPHAALKQGNVVRTIDCAQRDLCQRTIQLMIDTLCSRDVGCVPFDIL